MGMVGSFFRVMGAFCGCFQDDAKFVVAIDRFPK